MKVLFPVSLYIKGDEFLHPVTNVFIKTDDEAEPDFQFVIEGSAVTDVLKQSIEFSNRSNGGINRTSIGYYETDEMIYHIFDDTTSSQASQYLIDWGDGTTTQVVPSTTPDEVIHTYGNDFKPEYIITIKNYASGYFHFESRKALLKLLTPMPEQRNRKCFSRCFDGCSNLKYVCDYFFKNCGGAVNFYSTFGWCTGLNDIPSTLFCGCMNAECLGYVFSGTGIKRIPKELFSVLHKLKGLSYAFMNCYSLVEVPDELLKGSNELLTVEYMFWYCTALPHTGDGVFEGCLNLINARGAYYGCYSLEYIGDSLFKNCTKLRIVDNPFPYGGDSKVKIIGDSIFEGCANYYIRQDQGLIYDAANDMFRRYTYLTHAGNNIFKNCPYLRSAGGVFSYCRNLEYVGYGTFSGTIVSSIDGIFEYCEKLDFDVNTFLSDIPNALSFYQSFCNCQNLTGTVPSIWMRSITDNYGYVYTASGYRCFFNCTKLSNYDAIPAAWK